MAEGEDGEEDEEEQASSVGSGDGQFFTRMADSGSDEEEEEEDEEMQDVEVAVQPTETTPAPREAPRPQPQPAVTIPSRPSVTVEEPLSSDEEVTEGSPRRNRRAGRLGIKFGDNNPCARCERDGFRCEARKCLTPISILY